MHVQPEMVIIDEKDEIREERLAREKKKEQVIHLEVNP